MTRSTLLRRLSGALVVGAAALWLGWVYLFFHFRNTCAGAADPTTGRVIALNSHGAVSYITAAQDTLLSSLSYGAIGLFLAGVLADVGRRRMTRK
jgi:hypothetical protein